ADGRHSRPYDGSHDFTRCKAVAERLLIGDRAGDIAPLAARAPISTLLSSASSRLASLGIDPMQADIEAHYHWIDNIVAGALIPACEMLTTSPPSQTIRLDYAPPKTLTQKADAVLVHKVWGLLIFALLMAGLFVTIFWLADPIMSAIDTGTKAL